TAGPRDILSMEIQSTGVSPLIPAERPDDARLVIGVRADAARGNATGDDPAASTWRSPLEVVLSVGTQRFPLELIDDTSDSFMRTGACVLDLSGMPIASNTIVLEFRAPRGFDRPPRLLGIEPN